MISAPFYPIIYVRGIAMTAGERDETSASAPASAKPGIVGNVLLTASTWNADA